MLWWIIGMVRATGHVARGRIANGRSGRTISDERFKGRMRSVVAPVINVQS